MPTSPSAENVPNKFPAANNAQTRAPVQPVIPVSPYQEEPVPAQPGSFPQVMPVSISQAVPTPYRSLAKSPALPVTQLSISTLPKQLTTKVNANLVMSTTQLPLPAL